MTEIKDDIKILSSKLLRNTIVQTAIVVSSACAFYFTLEAKLDKLYTLKEKGEEIWQLKFDQLSYQNKLFQTQMDGLQIQNQSFQKQLDIITVRLDDLKK